MKKKIFIIIFFVIICFPSIGMIFFKTDKAIEKREIQDMPSITKNGSFNIKYFDQLTNFFADNFALRQNMIQTDALIKENIFKESGNKEVIVGKKGYLFFGDSLDDYLGQNTLTKRQLNSCARVLYLLQENTVKKGKNFLFTVAPNKNTIYPEYMPKRYVKISDENNYTKLKKLLKNNKINTVFLDEKIKETGKEVYHKLDTHWNNQGAAMGCDYILSNLKKDHYDYNNEKYTIKKNFSGDLYEMLYPKGNKKDYNIFYDKKHEYNVVSQMKKVTDISIKTKNNGKKGSIVMYRDSFGNALIPFVADEYGSGYFTKAVPYNWTLQDGNNADDVVIELVERHIPHLINEAPIMEAPQRIVGSQVKEVKNCKTTVKIGELDEYLPITGTVDKNYISDDGKIFVRLKNKDRNYIFEAFPAPVTAVNNNKGYCYGLYLNIDNIKSGVYDIDIIMQKDEKLYSSGIKTNIEIQ